MIYLVLFCKFLITNECRIVFGRQGPHNRYVNSIHHAGAIPCLFAPRRACEPTDARSVVRRTERRSRAPRPAQPVDRRRRRGSEAAAQSILSPRSFFPIPDLSLTWPPGRPLSFCGTGVREFCVRLFPTPVTASSLSCCGDFYSCIGPSGPFQVLDS